MKIFKSTLIFFLFSFFLYYFFNINFLSNKEKTGDKC